MENSFEILPPIMFTIKFDVNKHLAPQGRLPSEYDKEDAPESLYVSMINEYHEKNDNIMFSNVEFRYETCDCEYPCSHQPWISGIEIENHTGIDLYFEDEFILVAEKTKIYSTIFTLDFKNPNLTVGDVHRIFKLNNIDLKLSDYALSLIK